MDKINYKILIGIIILLFVIPMVLSISPILQVNKGTEGLEIKYPDFFNIQKNTNFKFNFHIFNLSNGIPINSGISCSFHLYNSSGVHVYNTTSFSIDHSLDYQILINGKNFSQIGYYSYIFQCNDSLRGGFINVPLYVTTSGYELPTEQSTFYIILLFMSLVFFILFLYGFLAIKWGNHRNMNGEVIGINDLKYFKIVFGVMAYLTLLWIINLIYGISSNFVFLNGISNLFSVIFRFMTWFSYPLILLCIIMGVIKFFSELTLQKKLKRGGR